jgi:hypothetical protein
MYGSNEDNKKYFPGDTSLSADSSVLMLLQNFCFISMMLQNFKARNVVASQRGVCTRSHFSVVSS